MIPLDAIRAAIINAAVLLGRSQARGAVAPGEFADMIAIRASRSRTPTSCGSRRH